MIRIKICGITNLKDALTAVDMGVDALGFVFYPLSKRYIRSDDARRIVCSLPPFVTKVGVFVDEPWDKMMKIRDFCRLDMIQVYGDFGAYLSEMIPEITIFAYRIRGAEDIRSAKSSPAFPLLDAYVDGYGGRGRPFDWSLLQGFDRPYILAGGINEENILSALKYRPYAIDISSGVESKPGVKDPEKMKRIFDALCGYERGR
ncbi:MAG: phosphoribosylanthranilate isomerase [Syntrophorhabdaceae bacterium]|nr:phosphoribosylanthranilate isomerase [Syntrophorhabdaceae bacterium]